MIVSKEFIDKVVEVTRVSERLMTVKLIVGKVPYECYGSLCTTDREESRRKG